MKKLNLLFICAALGFCSTLFAQTADRPWTLSLFGVKTEYLGDMRKFENPNTSSNLFNHTVNTVFNFDMNHGGYLGGGLQVSRYLSRFFDLGLYASYSSIGFDYYDLQTETRRNFNVESLINANLNTRIKFLGNDNYRVVPYITLGLGGLYYMNPTTRAHQVLDGNNEPINRMYDWSVLRDPANIGVPNPDHTMPDRLRYTDSNGKEVREILQGLLTAGVGLEVKLTDAVSLRYQADFGWTTADRMDFFVQSERNDWQLQHSLGLAFNFGKKKDADGDGVKDKNDQCPNTPSGVAVDKNGCPIDSDGDGVPDYLDACPNEAGTVNGCPDADGDGVADKDDQCSNTPSGVRVDANGCPIDSDGDGVADHLDRCPNTPRGVQVDANGCPIDSDGDGVADHLDKCPNTPAGVKVDATGCPIVKIETVTIQEKLLFDTGKSTIRPNPNAELEALAAKLKGTSSKVSIFGFTDNVGEPHFNNQRLSEERAGAVKAYLVKKGVNANNIEAIGRGVSNTFDNNTAEGRERNRRVEISFEVQK